MYHPIIAVIDTPQDPVARSVIRSFVRREGRLTPGQQRALAEGLPRFGIGNDQGVIDFDALFQRKARTHCEIGFGNGETLLTLAQHSPDTNFIGVEVYRPGVGNLLRHIERHGISNIRICTDDAVELLATRFPDNALDACLIFFPDPWPKKRHHKRRLIQNPFLDVVARSLRCNGRLHIATDWAPYAEHILDTLNARRDFRNTAVAGGYVDRPASRPTTKFERRGLKLGHQVFDIMFERR